MKIAQTYSHLNGEEYLIVHHSALYEEIKKVIGSIDASKYLTKISREARKMGQALYAPKEINSAFYDALLDLDWESSRYDYYITMKRDLMDQTIRMPHADQKKFLIKNGETDPIYSYNQTDFVKNGIAVEVQFGKYAFVAYDLFVKHMMFYTGGKINLGVEIMPTKKLQSQMSSGVPYYEGEVYNIMRQGRNTPAMPLLIIGIEPD